MEVETPGPPIVRAVGPGARGVAATLVVALAACGEGGGPPVDPVSVRDSAGVRIVVHDASAPVPAQWTVAAEPTIRIGAVDDPDQQLSNVRGGRVLGDGRIVVADGGSASLRFFGPDGRFEGSVGAPGEGPGEFAGLRALAAAPGDSLYAYDSRLRRLSVFGPDGTYVRSFRLAVDGERGQGVFAAAFDDGTILVQGFANAGGGEMPEGRYVPRSALYHYGSTGELLDSVPVVREGDSYIEPVEFPGGMGIWFTTPLFAHGTHVDAGPVLYVARTRGPSLEIRAPGGELRTRVRTRGLDLEVTPERTARQREALLAAVEDEEERIRVRNALDEMPVPDSMPAFAALAVDDAGRAWLRAFQPEGDEAPGPWRWTVYERDGVPVATAETPAGVRPLHIGRSSFLGLARDELDVEYVQLHALVKPGS
jgi:hypothetical protein